MVDFFFCDFLGSLMVVPQSHTSSKWKDFRKEYGSSSVGRDGTVSGWFSDNALDLEQKYGHVQWATHSFGFGDICLFGVNLIHMTAENSTLK